MNDKKLENSAVGDLSVGWEDFPIVFLFAYLSKRVPLGILLLRIPLITLCLLVP